MKNTILTKEDIIREYRSAQNEETRDVLRRLFPEYRDDLRNKPTLDDYTTIRSYEDACEALSVDTIRFDSIHIPIHILALMKLETISRSLWGKEWNPSPDPYGNKMMWWPWFRIYTKEEAIHLSPKKKQRTLNVISDDTGNDLYSFGYVDCIHANSRTNGHLNYSLAQETEEKANYFGATFVKLWAEYLQYGFNTGEYLSSIML
ncbi:MAG: hypothetical protein ACI36Z_03185 [Alloprevotella sp.]